MEGTDGDAAEFIHVYFLPALAGVVHFPFKINDSTRLCRAEDHLAKRSRLLPEDCPGQSTCVIRDDLLKEKSVRDDLAREFKGGSPYPHCSIPNFCNANLLRRVRDEIIDNIQATYKETDLFKMLQTGDLANMDKLDKESMSKLPSLRALRDALYSKEFREIVSEITGCGQLSEQTDCACNIHPIGGHLLCHDDVIGNRKVSFIIYLTDPDDPWKMEDGGALELYPRSEEASSMPGVKPTAQILPLWNTMAMFVVEPGRSFHAIQEVYTDQKPRMSIQGWYHAAKPPVNAEIATLRQLQQAPGEDDLALNYQPFSNLFKNSDDHDLTDADVQLLSQWVSPIYYQDNAAAAKIRSRFEDDGSVQLHDFLCNDKVDQLLPLLIGSDKESGLGCSQVPSYDAGTDTPGWEAVGPAHKQRYLRYKGTTHDVFNEPMSQEKNGSSCAKRAGEFLLRLQNELLCSEAFARLVKRLTTLTLTHHYAQVRRFRPGLDYTVAHYGCMTKDPRLDAILCFVDEYSNEEAAEAWESGEVGGFQAYLLADEDEAKPAEVYRGPADDEDSGVLNVSAGFNKLSLVLRDEGLMSFVKYLSYQAPGSRWDVAVTYIPEDDSDPEDGD